MSSEPDGQFPVINFIGISQEFEVFIGTLAIDQDGFFTESRD